MKQLFHEIKINTKGQGLYDFTSKTISWLNSQNIANGILNINILHTSASLVIQENADPDVLYDLKNFFDKLVPMDNKLYKHTTEGKDEEGNVKKVLIYPTKSKAMNLAFDVTPAKYVTGLITEKGVCEASEEGLKKLFK